MIANMTKNVIVGVSSGIAAYKTLDLIKLLKTEGLNCVVIMTRAATQMVDASDFEKESGNRVYVELFEKDFNYKNILKSKTVDHIALADSAGVFAVVPATANTIAKIASGFADDFLTTALLAATCPVIICPSMNTNMWNSSVVVENIKKLRDRGYRIVEPTVGMLACGYFGIGRLEEVEKIKEEVACAFKTAKSLAGKKVLVTAGATREKIDDVRFITNKSSGKMGVAIAEVLWQRGAKVKLLRAKSAVLPRFLMEQAEFETFEDLQTLISKEVKNYDVIVHAAAVGDFSVSGKVSGKIKSNEKVRINLEPRVKIVDSFKKLNPKIKVIVFKAEFSKNDEGLERAAKEFLAKGNFDVVVANDISKQDRGFDADNNEVVVVMGDKSVKKIPLASKQEVAGKIVDYLVQKGAL